MTPHFSKHTCFSSDISINDEKLEGLSNILGETFPEQDFRVVKVRQISLSEYFQQQKHWSKVVILFGGYNIKRYFHNCWKHLIFFPGKIYGLNIEGKVFLLPRFYAIKSIFSYEIKARSFRFLTKILSSLSTY